MWRRARGLTRILWVSSITVVVIAVFYLFGAMQAGQGTAGTNATSPSGPTDQTGQGAARTNSVPTATPTVQSLARNYCDDPNELPSVRAITPQPGWELPADPRLGLTVVAGPPPRAPDGPSAGVQAIGTPTPNLSIVSRGTLAPRPSDTYLATHAAVIAVVTIIDCGAPRWATPGNQKPIQPGRGIYRPISLRVDQPIKGAAQGQVFTVAVGGGTVDGVTHEVEPRSRYYYGQRFLVFLGEPGISPDGTRLWPVSERDLIDANGIATDEFYPDRRWPIADRLGQIQALVEKRQ